MNHPKIIAGRHGLPPTSNIPWSATVELQHRREVLLYFSVMCITAAVGLFLFLFRLWIPGAICLTVTIPIFFILLDVRRHLLAMLLNRPRSTQGLTQWTEHRWTGWEVEARQFICECGRLVDLSVTPFYPDSNRYAKVCECGRGHFLPRPSMRMGKVIEEIPRRKVH